MNNSTRVVKISNSSSSNSNLEFIILCVFVISLVVTLITNTITVVVMVRTPILRTCTNAFIVSLSVSDILFALLMLGLSVGTIVRRFVPFYVDPVTLQIVTAFAWGIQIHGSNGNLVLVSVERWLYITQPFLYQRFVSSKTVIASIAVTWAVSLAVNIPYLCFNRNLYMPKSYFVVSTAYVNPTIHTVCCLTLIAIYTHICFITLQHMKRISKIKRQTSRSQHQQSAALHAAGAPGAGKTTSLQAENWKSVKLLVTICGMFFVFVSPYAYFIAFVLTHPTVAGSSTNTWLLFFLLLLTLFHCSNFFVYSLGIRHFKNVIKRQACRFRCCRGSRVAGLGEATFGSQFDMETRTQNLSYLSTHYN